MNGVPAINAVSDQRNVIAALGLLVALRQHVGTYWGWPLSLFCSASEPIFRASFPFRDAIRFLTLTLSIRVMNCHD